MIAIVGRPGEECQTDYCPPHAACRQVMAEFPALKAFLVLMARTETDLSGMQSGRGTRLIYEGGIAMRMRTWIKENDGGVLS